jgi:hypothetical protein
MSESFPVMGAFLQFMGARQQFMGECSLVVGARPVYGRMFIPNGRISEL